MEAGSIHFGKWFWGDGVEKCFLYTIGQSWHHAVVIIMLLEWAHNMLLLFCSPAHSILVAKALLMVVWTREKKKVLMKNYATGSDENASRNGMRLPSAVHKN